MKVLFLTVDDETRASSRTRVYQFLPYLKDYGIQYEVIAWNGKAIKPKYKYSSNIIGKLRDFILCELLNYFVSTFLIIWGLFRIRSFDAVFIQKITLWRLLFFVRLMKIKYVYDIDDAIYTQHSAELAKNNNKTVKATLEFMKTEQMIVELPATEEVAKKYCKHVSTILGPVDTNRYRPSQIKDPLITIGWIGSHGNTYYLLEIQKALETVCKKYPNVQINLIGAKGLKSNETKIHLINWGLDTELHDLSYFDIGIMPLTDDEWSRGKGAYKLLQYMALGIPSVVSPVGVNKNVQKDGVTGYFAMTNDEYIEKLSRLIENEPLRAEMGRNARKAVLENWSLEASVPIFVAAIKGVAKK